MQRVRDFHYELPEELIAQSPLPDRAGARMLVVHRATGNLVDDRFANLPNYLRAGDCLVMNNTKVFPARLHGRRNHSDGAVVELFLLEASEQDPDVWTVLARPAKRVRTGDQIQLAEGVRAEVMAEGDRGERTLLFRHGTEPLAEVLDRIGAIPLPPYIHRAAEPADQERYQTVFAEHRGSVAAPTAGLHFTPEVLARCRAAGATIAHVTLHVGLGTFAPLNPEQLLPQVRLHRERYAVEDDSMAAMAGAARRVCIGTTSVRALESALRSGQARGSTELFISPGYSFQGTDALLTNFHLPASSLLMLVCAFAGTAVTMAAYRHAVAERYRFFSYGDCMLIA